MLNRVLRQPLMAKYTRRTLLESALGYPSVHPRQKHRIIDALRNAKLQKDRSGPTDVEDQRINVRPSSKWVGAEAPPGHSLAKHAKTLGREFAQMSNAIKMGLNATRRIQIRNGFSSLALAKCPSTFRILQRKSSSNVLLRTR